MGESKKSKSELETESKAAKLRKVLGDELRALKVRTPSPVQSDAVELLPSALYKSRKHRRRLVGVCDVCQLEGGCLDGGGVCK